MNEELYLKKILLFKVYTIFIDKKKFVTFFLFRPLLQKIHGYAHGSKVKTNTMLHGTPHPTYMFI